MLFAITIVIFAILIPKTARLNLTAWPSFSPGSTGNTGVAPTSGSQIQGVPVSSSGSIRLSTGNARYTIQPYEEYITLENHGQTSVDITRWRLENGKSSRTYAQGSQYVRYASDVGIISKGAKVISPSGISKLENIILKPNERAIVTTGSPQNISPYTIVSFKENLCSGYLSEKYNFPSGIGKSCVWPNTEPGVKSLDSTCKKYVASLRPCHTPQFDGKDRQGDFCSGCVDGIVGLPSMCVSFIKNHYSYPGCLSYHQGDQNFEGSTWHVYLYRPWEMWAESDETLSLYDSQGNLVTQTSY